jgi:hypothetical protein
MPRCYLHIGPYKTGTTSIQGTLRRNRGRLRDQGFHILGSASPNHGGLLRYALDDDARPQARLINGETAQEAVAA